MNAQLDATTTVGEIVVTDFRAAEVFERFGIDFCCGGRRSLVEACRSAGTSPDDVIRALGALSTDRTDDDVSNWTIDRLIDHIVSTHHAYVRLALPAIARHLTKLVDVHGARHPELARVAVCVDRLRDELLQHMLKEEHVLFPYIRELVRSAPSGVGPRSPFGTVENPIRMMEREHANAGAELRIIRELTHDYAAPEDGCATYVVCLSELERFERDLHRHVHLENNVLFPQAVALEQKL